MFRPRHLRLLLIEDSEDDALLVTRELRRAGYEPVVTRLDNASALRIALRSGGWDAILADYVVPGFPIEDALRLARELDPDVPVIVVSGSAGEERAVKVMRLGAQDYIMKDRLARLPPAIERELHEAENRRQRRRADLEIADLNRALDFRLQELQKILEVVPIGICMADDPECRHVRVNPAMARIMGYDATAEALQPAPYLPGTGPRFSRHGVPIAPEQRPMETAIRTAKPQNNLELDIHRNDGTIAHLFGSAAPLLDESGRVRGCVAAYVDISERRAAEAALRSAEKLATVGRLAATIAHEINNPLEAVTNVLYLIGRSSKLDPGLRQFVRIAQSELDRIGTIVRHTLGFHREAAAPVAVRIRDIIEETLRLYDRRITNSEIEIVKRYDSDGMVEAFPGEMRQVFSNLLVNAIEAVGKKGRITIHVADVRNLRERTQPGVRVVIADNGPGIPANIRERIFDPFFTTKGEKGSGLGLWVSEGIVRKHGGSIRLRSRHAAPRSGTAISIYVPKAALQVVEERATA
ncbi:MAG TPA: ATP-binding protein [Terriglobales bacterium]|nr:ATP-binding protein [Terriglobales bacterium]